MTILMMFWVFFASALAEEPDLAITVSETRPNYQVIQIYVDITSPSIPTKTNQVHVYHVKRPNRVQIAKAQ